MESLSYWVCIQSRKIGGGKLGSSHSTENFWGIFLGMLGYFWGIFGVIIGYFWDIFGIFFVYFGGVLVWFGGYFEVFLGYLWVYI